METHTAREVHVNDVEPANLGTGYPMRLHRGPIPNGPGNHVQLVGSPAPLEKTQTPYGSSDRRSGPAW